MKKLFSYLFIGIAVCFLANSCSPKFTVREYKNLDVSKSTIATLPKIADLKIEDKKVTATVTSKINKETLDILKSNVMLLALNQSGADLLIEPIYEVSQEKRTIKVTVSGFPAKIIGFRDVQASDTLAFNVAAKMAVINNLNNSSSNTENISKITNSKIKKSNTDKKLGLGLGLGIPGVIGATILVLGATTDLFY